MGFLFLREQNYSEALKYYKKIVLLQPDAHSLILSIIEFLAERQNGNPGELGYNFAIGALNFAFADEKAGRRDLKAFIQQAGQAPQLAGMVAFANDLLNLGVQNLQKKHRRLLRKSLGGKKRKKRS